MTRSLAILLTVALITMTSAWRMPVDAKACAKATTSCCQQHAKNGAHEAPAIPDCPQCCLLCCAVLLPESAALAIPSTRIEKWNLSHESGMVRDERPPVPPPRWS